MGRKKKIIIELDEETNQVAQNVQKEDLKKLILQGESSTDVQHAVIDQEELNKEQKERQYQLRKFLIPKLRSASFRWKSRGEAIKLARKERGIYTCNICKADMKNGEFVLDHKEPVIDVRTGWIDFNTFIDRLFCSVDGFQVICRPCHDIKTLAEDELRKINRQKKKQKK